MNNIEDENGNIGSYLKIIRNESLGSYSWDSSEWSATNTNRGYGINEWSVSDIEVVLNDNYYNKKSNGTGWCYNGYDKETTKCPAWEKIGFNTNSKAMVSKVKWNTGTIPLDYYNKNLLTAKSMYEMERSENNGKVCTDLNYCNDDVLRTTSWLGYVGLMYPSDFGFATGGGTYDAFTRPMCLSLDMTYWKKDNLVTGCGSRKNWLYYSTDYSISQYTITSAPSSSDAFLIFSCSDAVMVSRASEPQYIRPVVYLNSDIKIEEDLSEDYGSSTNPFRIIVT